MPWGGIAAAGVGALSDIGMGAFSARSASDSQKLAYKYAKRMYQNRYQWAMDDMRQAGLNPILAYKGVGGAPTPGPGHGPINMPYGAVGRAVGTAKAASMMKSNVEEAHNRAGAAGASWSELSTRAGKNVAEQLRARADTELIRNSAKRVDIDTKLLEAQVPAAKAVQSMDETTYGKFLRWIRRTSEAVQGTTPSFGRGQK